MVVDDERHLTERGLDGAGERDLGARIALLVAQLHQRDPASGKLARELRQRVPAGALRIEDRVKPQIKLI